MGAVKLSGRFLPSLGTLLSTLFVLLSVPEIQWSAFVWVGLIPWFFGLRRCMTLLEALTQGLWLNLLLGFGGAFWVAGAAERYLSVSTPLAILILIAHALVHQLQIVAFAGVYWQTLRAKPPTTFVRLVGLALVYTGFDWIAPKLFQDSLGMVLYSSPLLRQLAAFGGTTLLTFVVALGNLAGYALVAEALGLLRAQRRSFLQLVRPGLRLAVPIAAFVALGAVEQARVSRALDDPKNVIRVGIVQGNVADQLRRSWAQGDADAARKSLERYVRGTERLLDSPSPPELVVWPETAYPGVFRKPESDAQLRLNVAFDRLIAKLGVPLAFGAYDREARVDRRVLRNGLYLVTPKRDQSIDELSEMQVYHKSTLFPFGEYLPFADEVTARQWLPGAAHLASGDGPAVLELRGADSQVITLGPSICYEDVFSSHARALSRLGAQLLINISNDSWFGDHGAARWHLMMATLRSIETRLPQVRATNSGYSAFILQDGSLRSVTEFGQSTEESLSIPLVDLGPTLFTRLGDWFGWLSLLLGGVFLRWC